MRHLFDCRIYTARKRFCDCGLVYNLQHLEFALANILYPDYEIDLAVQEGRPPSSVRPKTKKQKQAQKEALELLEKIFGPITKPDMEQIKYEYDTMKKIISQSFTKKRFRRAYERLDEWLDNELAKLHEI